jgi:uncharacterized delta-60 repeat protein
MVRFTSVATATILVSVAACSDFGSASGGSDSATPRASAEDDGGPAPVGGPAARGIALTLGAAGEEKKTAFIVQGKALSLPIKVVRAASSKASITIAVKNLPPSATAEPLSIPAGATDGVLIIRAASVTPQGLAALDVTAVEDVDGSADGKKLSAFVRGAPGALDTTFGDSGRVRAVFGAATSAVTDARVLSNGAIVVGGRRTNNPALARFTSNGLLDTTFAGGGRTNLAVSQGELFLDVFENGAASGSFLAALGAAATSATVLRTSLDGTPDPSFNGTGQAPMNLGLGNTAGREIVALAGGTSLVLTYQFGASKTIAVSRWKADGALDGSYGAGGICELDAAGTGSDVTGTTGMLASPDGSVRVSVSLANGQAVLKGCTANGLMDTTIGTAPDHYASVGAGALARYFDGGVVFLDAASWSRVNAALVVDTSIGAFGKVSVAPVTDARSVLTQPDGGILVAGNTIDSDATFTVLHFKSTGARDFDFGVDGVATLPIATNGVHVTKLVAQPDGRVLVLGQQGESFDGTIARIWP